MEVDLPDSQLSLERATCSGWAGRLVSNGPRKAFSLLEILVAIAILSMLLILLSSLASLTSNTYTRTIGKLQSFEAARAAFDMVTRTLSKATLLSQLGYNNPTSPTGFELRSDLHYISGSQTDLGIAKTGTALSHGVFFQAPLGLATTADLQNASALLSAVGYFIAYGDSPDRPAILATLTPSRYRFRLFQFLQPREEMSVYARTIDSSGIPTANTSFKTTEWFSGDVGSMKNCRVVAENVIALVLLPLPPSGTAPITYLWNSRDQTTPDTTHRLPSVMRVLMVAIDEKSAASLGNTATPPTLIPTTLFQDPAKFADDRVELENHLGQFTPKLNYEVFTTEVAVSSGNTKL